MTKKNRAPGIVYDEKLGSWVVLLPDDKRQKITYLDVDGSKMPPPNREK